MEPTGKPVCIAHIATVIKLPISKLAHALGDEWVKLDITASLFGMLQPVFFATQQQKRENRRLEHDLPINMTDRHAHTTANLERFHKPWEIELVSPAFEFLFELVESKLDS